MTALACGAGALALYAATLAPTVTGGDSGELVAVASTLGVAHPPGYPLYTLLAAAFARLPWGEVAWRVNLLSAVCGAAAAGLAAWSATRLSGQAAAGVVAAGLLATSPLVWAYAVTAEVFALNNAFVAALVAATVKAALDPPERRARWLVLAGALTGLGLGNHHTLVFMAAPALAFLVFAVPGPARVRALAVGALAGALGLAVYGYLPWAAARHPAVAWGDPTTPSGFLDHFLRREYGTFRLASADVGASGGDAGARLAQLVERVTATSYGALPLLALASLALLARRGASRTLVALWACAAAAYVIAFASLSNVRMDLPLHVTVQERFWQQALVPLSVLAGLGAGALAALGPPRTARAATAIAVAGVAGLAAVHFPAMNHRGRTFFTDWGAAVLASVPRDALLLATSDESIGSLRYQQEVLGSRRDVRVVPTGQVTRPWFRTQAAHTMPDIVVPPASAGGDFTARQLLDANVPRRPVALLNRVPWLATLEEAYTPWSIGLVDLVLPKSGRPSLETWLAGAEASFARFDPPRHPDAATWEAAVAESYWKQYSRFAQAVPRAAVGHDDPASHRAVVAALERYVARHPAPDRAAYKNLGVAYQFLARVDPQARSGMVRHWRTYLAGAPAHDPDLPAIRMLVARAEAEGVRP